MTGASEEPTYEFDVAVSFAGEDRELVKEIVSRLKDAGKRVFYDADYQSATWGEDLIEYLDQIYRVKARYTIMFISRFYAEKMWTRHERRSALERALEQRSRYVLPVRLDDTALEGLRSTIGYLDARRMSSDEIVKATLDILLTDTPPAQPDAIIRVPRTESRREQASEITNEAYEQVERENAEEQARLRRETQLRRNASRVARALQDHCVTPTELWPGTSRDYREPVDNGDGIRVIHNIEKRSYGPVRGWLIHQQMISPPSTYGEGLTIRYQLGDDGKIYENATPIEHPSNAEMDKIKRYLAYYGAQKGLDRELFRNDDA